MPIHNHTCIIQCHSSTIHTTKSTQNEDLSTPANPNALIKMHVWISYNHGHGSHCNNVARLWRCTSVSLSTLPPTVDHVQEQSVSQPGNHRQQCPCHSAHHENKSQAPAPSRTHSIIHSLSHTPRQPLPPSVVGGGRGHEVPRGRPHCGALARARHVEPRCRHERPAHTPHVVLHILHLRGGAGGTEGGKVVSPCLPT